MNLLLRRFGIFFLITSGLLSFAKAAATYSLVTAREYCKYLNNSRSSDYDHYYDDAMSSDPDTACILRQGKPGEYFYEVIAGRENYPVYYVSFSNEKLYSDWFQNRDLTDDIRDGDLLLKSNRSSLTMSDLAENQLLSISFLEQKSDNGASSTLSVFEEAGDICLVIGAVFLTKTMMKRGDSGTLPLDYSSRESGRNEGMNNLSILKPYNSGIGQMSSSEEKKVTFTLSEADQEKNSHFSTVIGSDFNNNEQQLIENQNRLRDLEARIAAGTSQQSIDLLLHNANLRREVSEASQEGAYQWLHDGKVERNFSGFGAEEARNQRIGFLKKAAASCLEAAKEAQKPDLNQQVVDLLKYRSDLYQQAARASDTDLDNAKSLAQKGDDLITELEEARKNGDPKQPESYDHKKKDFTKNSESSICNIM